MIAAEPSSASRAFLLRQGRRFPGNSKGWSQKFDRWVKAQRFDQAAAQISFDHYLAARSARDAQLGAINGQIEKAATTPPLAEPVATLRCLRGIDTLSAVTVVAEVCDFRRFATAPAFMAFTGLVPSEHSSGSARRQGPITKTGNRHVRRVLVEAAWTYRHRPYMSAALKRRSEDQPPEMLAYCWRAQLRLCPRYWHLGARGDKNVAIVAVARELAGFMWGLMTGRTTR